MEGGREAAGLRSAASPVSHCRPRCGGAAWVVRNQKRLQKPEGWGRSWQSPGPQIGGSYSPWGAGGGQNSVSSLVLTVHGMWVGVKMSVSSPLL